MKHELEHVLQHHDAPQEAADTSSLDQPLPDPSSTLHESIPESRRSPLLSALEYLVHSMDVDPTLLNSMPTLHRASAREGEAAVNPASAACTGMCDPPATQSSSPVECGPGMADLNAAHALFMHEALAELDAEMLAARNTADVIAESARAALEETTETQYEVCFCLGEDLL